MKRAGCSITAGIACVAKSVCSPSLSWSIPIENANRSEGLTLRKVVSRPALPKLDPSVHHIPKTYEPRSYVKAHSAQWDRSMHHVINVRITLVPCLAAQDAILNRSVGSAGNEMLLDKLIRPV